MNPVNLETGVLTEKQLQSIFRTIPQEFNFIDEKDIVRWYSNNYLRLFKRKPSDLNRHVLEVHPGKSKDRIVTLLKAFHEGTKEEETVIIPFKGKTLQISFYALKDLEGKYIGAIEVTQDVSHLVKQTKLGHFWKMISGKKK